VLSPVTPGSLAITLLLAALAPEGAACDGV
jgi:hypothetical protein